MQKKIICCHILLLSITYGCLFFLKNVFMQIVSWFMFSALIIIIFYLFIDEFN